MSGYDVSFPRLEPLRVTPISESAFHSLLDRIKAVQDQLDPDHEIGIVANGAGLVVHVESILRDGQIFVFTGSEVNGNRSFLIQHYSQLNMQIISVEKIDKIARRIGF